jgi:SpoVK/Ycf46/Vps4 family AAA+-type ATPase
LVITSNFPERIDRALIRPGRIDMIVKFGRCSTDVLKQMIIGFYDIPLPDHKIWDEKEIHLKWTPAEVNQILFRNFDSVTSSLDELVQLNPTDLYGFQIEGRSSMQPQ